MMAPSTIIPPTTPPAIGPALTDEPVLAGVDELVVMGVIVDTVDGVVNVGLRLTVEKVVVTKVPSTLVVAVEV